MTRQPLHASAAPTLGPSLITRNLRLGRGRTSIRLESLEWSALDAICLAEKIDRHHFAAQVDRDPQRREKTLTSRVRSAILAYFVARAGFELAAPVLRTGPARSGYRPLIAPTPGVATTVIMAGGHAGNGHAGNGMGPAVGFSPAEKTEDREESRS